MQDSLKPMLSLRDLVWLRVVRKTFRLQYTNFVLSNDSGLNNEEKIKIKCYFSLLGKLDKEEPLKQINRTTLA